MLNEGLGVASGVFVADSGMASLNMWECKRDLRGICLWSMMAAKLVFCHYMALHEHDFFKSQKKVK